MQSIELNEREKYILRSIIHQFIITANPVGSRNIVKKYDLGVSPATVRNIMADLEDFGFLDHPHTSAGRIPTDLGYRFYVDSLMDKPQLNSYERKSISHEFELVPEGADELLRITSILLSDLTNQLACVTFPKFQSAILEKLQLVSISSNRLLVVVTIKSGLIKTITMEVNSEISTDNLSATQQILNERLSGLNFNEIRKEFSERFKDIHEKYRPLIRVFLESAEKIFKDDPSSNKTIITGTKNILKHPEFVNIENFKGIIELVEDKDIIFHVMDSAENNDNIVIKIGNENQHEKLTHYSLIKKEYKVGDISGTIGIIGPKRMDYGKVIAVIDYLTNLLGELLIKTTVK